MEKVIFAYKLKYLPKGMTLTLNSKKFESAMVDYIYNHLKFKNMSLRNTRKKYMGRYGKRHLFAYRRSRDADLRSSYTKGTPHKNSTFFDTFPDS